MSKEVTPLHAHAPSGEIVGGPMRRIAQSASIDSGGLSFADRRVAPREMRGIGDPSWVQCGFAMNLPGGPESPFRRPSIKYAMNYRRLGTTGSG